MPKDNTYLWEIQWQRHLLLLIIICLFLPIGHTSAQPEETKIYTEESPLVYEDAEDLWPYSYLNDEGQPEGFNIDLVEKLMRELNIPYVVRLKPAQEAFDDLKTGKADLTLGLAAGFHDAYGHYGRHTITLFTQSVATPKSKTVEIKTFRDLGKEGLKVIVNDSSLCHHLMLDYGWGDNAIVSRDMKKSIQQISADGEGQIVWNTLSLRWLIKRYHLSNLELTPVNMPHGEYKFMSNDQHLLDLLDEAYTNLHLEDEIAPIENKWLYPERQEKESPLWFWVLIGIASLLLIAAIVGFVSYQLRFRRVMKTNKQLNRRLALINETTKVRIWTYDVNAHEFSWRDENGRVAYTYTMEEFSHRYSEADFKHLKDALDRLISQHKDAKGHEEEQVTLELKAKDMEDGDNEVRTFLVVVSVLRRDEHGKPSVLIGTKKDVTEARRLKRLEDERTLRYWSIFYSQDAAIILFDRLGVIQDISPKACELCRCDGDKLIKQRIHINDLFQSKFTDMSKVNGFHAIQVVNDVKIEYQLKTFYNDSNELLGIFAFCQKDQSNL
jgi:PAS domain-containing protein